MLKIFLKIFFFTALALVAAVIIIEGIKGTHRETLKKKKAEYTVIKSEISQIEKIKAERAGFFSRIFFLDYPVRLSYSASDFIRKLGLKPTPSLKLTDIKIFSGIEKFSFFMKGRVRSFSKKGAYPKFLRFFSYLNSFENILFISHSELEPVKEDTSERIQNEFGFTISGEIETE